MSVFFHQHILIHNELSQLQFDVIISCVVYYLDLYKQADLFLQDNIEDITQILQPLELSVDCC